MNFIEYLTQPDQINEVVNTPQPRPIRKVKALWDQVSNKLVEIEDELLDAQKMYPEDEGVERALWYLNNDEYAQFVKELRYLHDK